MNLQDSEEIKGGFTKEESWKRSECLKKGERPKNCLLEGDIEFETSVFTVPISKDTNRDIFKYINMRFKEKTFDNFEFKEKKPVIVEEVYDTEALETEKEVKLLYEQLESELKKLTDGGIDGFL